VDESFVISLAVLVLAVGCGSDRDLVIGRNVVAIVAPRDAAAADVSEAAVPSDAIDETEDAPPDETTIEATPCVANEVPPPGSLLHRYSFDGTGTIVHDSVGNADGNAIGGAMLSGDGSLSLDGNNDYVNLPNGLISSLNDVTLVAWVSERDGGPVFERIFDFGSSTAGEDRRAMGKSFVMVTPYSQTGDGQDLTMQAGTPALGVIQIATNNSIRDGNTHQVGAVFRSGVRLELLLDGVLLGIRPTRMKLSDIDDVNNWLGQSQFSADANFGGTYLEFRIYGQALSACALTSLLSAGPDSLP
jgi:hypothetical protein